MRVKEIIKETIIRWSKAVELHNSGKYTEAAECYSEIKDVSARMCYNQACAYIKLGIVDNAIESLSRAIEKDEHLAMAYFQRGTLYLQNKSTMKAIADLEMARTLLRGNTYIYYKPLGLYTTLSSFQILQNLALAYINTERLEDARRWLTEALHDADDLQRKSITVSLERINDSRTDLIPVMQVSADKVFTPPKSITQNLEKKGIVRKAKVVSASNKDDRNAAFHGSKRVRELKQLPTSPTSPFNPLKRIVKNRPPLNHSISDLNELTVIKGMKSNKSTSFSVKSSSPVVSRVKRLFQKRTPSSADKNTSPGIRLNHSSGELTGQFSPAANNTGKSSSRTAFVGVRKLQNNNQNCQMSMPPCDDEMQVLVMRESGSTRDLSTLDMLSSKCDSEGDLPPPSNIRSKNALNEQMNFDSNHHRNSLGSVFDDYLTIVGRSVATLIQYENYVTNVEHDQESASIDCKSSPGEIESDNPVTFNINTMPDNDAGAETSKTNATDKAKESRTSSATRKSRPPPPSYPPPPLPPNIVIYV
ncbi:NADPH oxidase activator-like [Mercenaria mercenaria]|uniref:NADPH oxidase activator-like n=1 Tax=Mercenaria mercenaria TaxID=6596 RepID=UPI00234F0228|nr:NADPH oxidase activator-like [Mercenaria mercenaria]